MKKCKKAILSLLMTAMFAMIWVFPAFAEQTGPDVFAEGYCVMNGDTGEIIFQKAMDERFYPASITKVLTAFVVLEQCGDRLDEQLTFSDYAINSLTANSSTLTPKAGVGETMTVRDALYGMILCSANECANALAEYTAGSVEAFAELMNQKAQAVGAVNSHFVNPHGLHGEEHYTTPHDMALIFEAAMKNEAFAKLLSTVHYTIPATNLQAARECTMSHQLVNGSIPYEGVYAGKTGNTAEAGRTLITEAKRYGVNLIVVIMKSDNDHFYTDTEILLEYGFGFVSGAYGSLAYTEVNDTVISSGGLRVREFPSTYAKQVVSLQAGDAVHRIGTYAGWSKVEAGGGTYYVATDFLLDSTGVTVAEPFTTAAPTDAVPPETEAASEEETPAREETSAEAGQENPSAASEQTLGTQEVSRQTQEVSAKSHTYEINEEVLTTVILIVIVIIAILAGLLVAALIMRRA